ncbi:acyltransferase family protein [Microbacterium sp. AGC85]
MKTVSSRIDWVDAAKTLAIILVVVYHVSGWVFDLVFAGRVPGWTNPWRQLSDLLIPVRIPLFFLISGVLAHRAVQRPWRTLLRTRISDLLWPFAVWSVLIAPLWFVRLEATGVDGFGYVLGGIAFGGTHLWFLTALALFLVVGKATSRVPRSTLVVAACLAFVLRYPVSAWLSPDLPQALTDNIGRWMIFLFWFLLGCSARKAVFWVAARPWWFAIGGTAVVVLVATTGTAIPGELRVPVLAFAGVAALVAWSVVAVRVPVVARLSRYLAARTLAIYVGHAFLLEALALGVLVLRRFEADQVFEITVLAIVFVPVVTALLVFVTTWFYDRCTRSRFAWVFQPPWQMQRDTTGAADHPRS